MNINYEYYRIFYYVAKHQNLSQAAEVLHNNQPNISRTIKLMEHEFGCNLIIRSHRGISLTPEGEQLFSHVKIMVDQIEQAEEELLTSAGLQKGRVAIGASETALRMLLLPVLKNFRKIYPNIYIRILNNLTNQALESVLNEQVDFALITGPAEIRRPLSAKSVFAFNDILLCGADYSDLTTASLSLEDLTGYPIISLGENTTTYKFYSDLYRSHRLEFKPELEAATTDQIIPMIIHNLGIGFVPPIYAAESEKKGEVCRLKTAFEIPARRIYFVENENHPLSVAASELKRLLLEYAGCVDSDGTNRKTTT